MGEERAVDSYDIRHFNHLISPNPQVLDNAKGVDKVCAEVPLIG